MGPLLKTSRNKTSGLLFGPVAEPHRSYLVFFFGFFLPTISVEKSLLAGSKNRSKKAALFTIKKVALRNSNSYTWKMGKKCQIPKKIPILGAFFIVWGGSIFFAFPQNPHGGSSFWGRGSSCPGLLKAVPPT